MPPPHAALSAFQPLVRDWFVDTLGEPTEPQVRGWPLIRAGRDVLLAAPTGSGKTLAAFLSCLDELLHLAERGELPDETRVLYVSPLKALGNDVQKNLLEPLARLEERARARGTPLPPLRVAVRSGDTPASERAAMLKRPPHILITTPESLYLLLTSERSRQALRTVRTVIVDEIHALARDKRGAHFALSLERLAALTPTPPQRVGLSATTRPLDRMARFLTGAPREDRPPCEVVQVGHVRPWELSVETPQDELTAVATHEMWGQVYDRLVELTATHRTMLVFANTRKMAERLAHDLGARLGPGLVHAHHGSMAREARLLAEERLKSGHLKVMVATASLELGIDVGAIDLVVQVGSPRSIAVMLQRLGRSGHHKAAVSRGLILAMTRDELVEAAALVRAVREGALDVTRMPDCPLDVLAQQVVAEVAAQEWDEAPLCALVRRAMPYEGLTAEAFEQVLDLVSEGVATSRGRSRVHLHRDRVHGRLRPRKGARLTALQNGGAIPDTFQYAVIAEPEDKQVGTLDEDYAVESSAGDVFVLGSATWRIRRIAQGQVRVEAAPGVPPSIPFWLGEAPARTDELSREVGRLREDVLVRPDAVAWLTGELGLPPHAADLLCRYVRAGSQALGAAPSQAVVVAERFFDEAGGMQLVLHAPFGARINRAWGLALRKSFCRAFDFELQAAATDDGILLSLGEQHSFPLLDIFDFVQAASARRVLVQAVLQGPMFGTRFRWAAGRALVLSRQSGGRRVPPILQRARAEDLIAAVFPEQVGCQDNHGGQELEVPDHPLVAETMKDCLTDLMDVEGLERVLLGLKAGTVKRVAVDLPEPSVFSHQLLNSAPYTYLDDAPLEERRARAVSVRRTLPAGDVASFGALDGAAIAQVVGDAAPVVRDAEELHDALLQLGLVPRVLAEGWAPRLEDWLGALVAAGRAGVVDGALYAAERVPLVQALRPGAPLSLAPLPGDGPLSPEDAARQAVRGWLEVLGPTSAAELAHLLGLPVGDVTFALGRIEAQGQVLRGSFRPEATPGEVEWCDRRLLQRIHRLTVGRLRKEIEPLSPADFMRFLFRWHHLSGERTLRGPLSLAKVVGLLEGYEAPAAAWEQALLPARMQKYSGEWLEQACWSGEVAWGRLALREPKPQGPRRGLDVPPEPPRRAAPGRAAGLTFFRRAHADWLLQAARPEWRWDDGPRPWPADLSGPARAVLEALERRGASFFTELAASARRLPAEVEDALFELLSRGLVTADAIQNLRVLLSPKLRRHQRALQRGGPGRWSLLVPRERVEPEVVEERVAWLFLNRYGVVFRDLLVREPLAPPWRELARLYRRLEDRGEVRGGRFLAGFAGEQFAAPDAVELARSVRRAPPTGERVVVAAVDPLNLTGLVTPGPRVPATLGQTVTYVDGVPREFPVPGDALARR